MIGHGSARSRRGYTMTAVLIALMLLFALWCFVARTTSSLLRIETNRVLQQERDQGAMNALAQAVQLLQYSTPSDPDNPGRTVFTYGVSVPVQNTSGGCTSTDYTVVYTARPDLGPTRTASPGRGGVVIRATAEYRGQSPVAVRGVDGSASRSSGRRSRRIRTRGNNHDNPCGRPKWIVEGTTAVLPPATMRGKSLPSTGVRRSQAGSGCPSVRDFPKGEARADMGRVARLIIAATTLTSLCGCAGPGLYRSIGSFPGIAWTDYAFTFYCDAATQVFQFTPPQVETSMLESLADMGFAVTDPPARIDGECVIKAKAPDGRNVRVTIRPQNAMTMVTVVIQPCLGDYQLSRDLLRRVALNFGSGMRAYTPVDLTVNRRINCPTPGPPSTPPPPPGAR